MIKSFLVTTIHSRKVSSLSASQCFPTVIAHFSSQTLHSHQRWTTLLLFWFLLWSWFFQLLSLFMSVLHNYVSIYNFLINFMKIIWNSESFICTICFNDKRRELLLSVSLEVIYTDISWIWTRFFGGAAAALLGLSLSSDSLLRCGNRKIC